LAKFLKIVLIVCSVVVAMVVAIPVVLVGSLLLWSRYQVELFYDSRPLLRAMRFVESDTNFDSAPARKVLLRRLPLGTDREAAVAVLRNEGFDCFTSTDSFIKFRPNESTADGNFVICTLEAPGVILLSNGSKWRVDLKIDADQHVSETGVSLYVTDYTFMTRMW